MSGGCLSRPIGNYSIEFDYPFSISTGNVKDHHLQRKFFHNFDQGTAEEDVWDYAPVLPLYVYTAPTGADYYIFSDDNTDNQIIGIAFLDNNFDLRQFIIQLQGHTPVQVNNYANVIFQLWGVTTTPFSCTRIYRMRNLDSTVIQGNIYCTEGNDVTNGVPNDVNDVRAYMQGFLGTTFMSHYTVPNNYYMLWNRFDVSITNKQAAAVDARVAVKLEGGVFVFQDITGLNAAGTSIFDFESRFAQAVPPKTDFKLRASASTNCGFGGSYLFVLVHIRYINREGGIIPL